MTRLLLVRHGESEWNALGRWQGQADPPLSELGRRQARAATERLDRFDRVVASDLQRARVTAEILALALGLGEVVVEPDLRERDCGEWSGLTRAEIDERWPGYLSPDRNRRVLPPGRRHPRGWEHDDALLARALTAVNRIATGGGGPVLAVTHGGIIYRLEDHLGAEHRRLANLEGRWFMARDGGLELGERVLLVDPDDVAVTVPGQI